MPDPVGSVALTRAPAALRDSKFHPDITANAWAKSARLRCVLARHNRLAVLPGDSVLPQTPIPLQGFGDGLP